MHVDSFAEPRVEILGAPDLYIQRKSMINLTCIMHNVPEPPASVLWYHNNKVRGKSVFQPFISKSVTRLIRIISSIIILSASIGRLLLTAGAE